MIRRLMLAIALVFAVLTGFLAGQKNARPIPGGPTVYAGEDFGFRADGHVGDVNGGTGWVTGRFVVKVQGRWVDARLAPTVVPAGK